MHDCAMSQTVCVCMYVCGVCMYRLYRLCVKSTYRLRVKSTRVV